MSDPEIGNDSPIYKFNNFSQNLVYVGTNLDGKLFYNFS